MAEREVRYCTTEDGVRIAYCVEGEGPPLVVSPIFITSFSLVHLVPKFEHMLSRVGEGRQLVQYDMRGTGLSQREVGDLNYGATLRDMEAVVRTLGLKRFSLLGMGIGGPRAIEYAACHPRQVDKLILAETFARVLDTLSREILQGFAQLARANWEVASRTIADLALRRQDEQESLRWADLYQKSISAENMARFIENSIDLDVSFRLTRVKCPTLVLHYMDHPVYPFSCAQQLAEAIPDATFVPQEGFGTAITGYTGPTIDTLVAFLDERKVTATRERGSPPGTLRTVLFTDLVGHTEMMSRLGDERGRAVLRDHERITREVLKANGGTEVKTMGDGFMASFGSVTKAVECAIALQRAFAQSEGESLSVRVGLNAGEPIEEEGDLFGATVILASRIAAKAEGGEILVADTVRGLCSGKGFLFADRGEFVAKGFEEPVRVCEVSWRHGVV